MWLNHGHQFDALLLGLGRQNYRMESKAPSWWPFRFFSGMGA
jgi:hypothetical protein